MYICKLRNEHLSMNSLNNVLFFFIECFPYPYKTYVVTFLTSHFVVYNFVSVGMYNSEKKDKKKKNNPY